jgi:hypothetical protein
MSLYEEHLQEIKDSAIGCAVEVVSEKAKKLGWSIRVMKSDGKNCIGTCDYNPGRINIAVVDGIVTDILSVG